MRPGAFLLAFLATAAVRAVVADAPAKPETVEESASRVLHEKAFVFCRDNESPVPPDERDWCEVADSATTCPQLKAMCDRPVEGGAKDGEDGKGKADGKKDKPKAEVGKGDDGEAARAFDLHIPGMDLLPWIALGLVLAIIAFVIVRAVLDRKKDLPVEDGPPPELEAAGALAFVDPGLGEVQLLLRRALELADRDVGLALACLYAAVLKHLEEKQLITWDVTTTNREYVRAIRGKTPIDRPMAELVREVERTKFGHAAPARSRFDTLYQAIAPSLARLAAVFAMGLFLGGCGNCYGRTDLDGRAAFNEILRSRGVEVGRFALPINQLSGTDAPVLVDAQDYDLDETVLGALEKAVLGGARVIVLLSERSEMESWPHLAAKPGAKGALVPSEAFGADANVPGGLAGALQGSLRLVVPAEERDPPEVLVTRGGEPFAVRWRSEHGQITFVADRRLFANGAMAIPADVRLAVGLALDTAGEKKTLQLASIGPAQPAESPQESLEKAGLWALVLQAIVATAVWFLAKGLAFGALRDRTRLERRAFSEHIGALGIQLMRRSGSRLATSLYAGWALERLRARANRDVDRKDARALAKDLAPRADENEDDLRQLIETAEAMRRDPNGISVPERDFAVMRRLSQLLHRLQAAGRRAA